eukprot:TRINITY_DN19856_c1_g1_i4.p1 TRINITY_DN19856_c1_g1~~TRINITY_DN19856_c1_g1_i4.p1  ORF type:complete len:339 (-),score=60.14 TRINITY_DN19856_c1_g1_i4:22-933(-)
MAKAYMPVVDDGYTKAVEGCKRELRAFIAEKNCAPLMLRLAWHDAGEYDKNSNTGGPNGSIRTEMEINHQANMGLRTAVTWCEDFKAKFPVLSYADIYQLAGYVAVEVTGGPEIPFTPGRKDSLVSPPEGRLPDAHQGAPHLRDVFYRMGLDDKDIVALSGGHTLGRAHKDRSGFEGPWTQEPLKFDNSYFKELLAGEKDGLLQLPTDKVLVTDQAFRPFVDLYAKDNEAFFRDYAESHKKLSELGCADSSPAFAAAAAVKHVVNEAQNTLAIVSQGLVGIVATVVICVLGYMYEVRRSAAKK